MSRVFVLKNRPLHSSRGGGTCVEYGGILLWYRSNVLCFVELGIGFSGHSEGVSLQRSCSFCV